MSVRACSSMPWPSFHHQPRLHTDARPCQPRRRISLCLGASNPGEGDVLQSAIRDVGSALSASRSLCCALHGDGGHLRRSRHKPARTEKSLFRRKAGLVGPPTCAVQRSNRILQTGYVELSRHRTDDLIVTVPVGYRPFFISQKQMVWSVS
jgi:hypothetical protein